MDARLYASKPSLPFWTYTIGPYQSLWSSSLSFIPVPLITSVDSKDAAFAEIR